LVRKKTASSGTVTVTALRSVMSDSRKAVRLEFASRLLHAFTRLLRVI
jgi:hypothetical protein